jgi:hypothetical protein
MDFYELLDIPQGDRRKYHDDVTIMVISLEGRIWKSSGTYVWCWYFVCVSIYSDATFSWNLFSWSTLPGNCIYAHREKSQYGILICSPDTLDKVEFSSWRSLLILISASAQLMSMSSFQDTLRCRDLTAQLGRNSLAEQWANFALFAATAFVGCILTADNFFHLAVLSWWWVLHLSFGERRHVGTCSFFSHSCEEWACIISKTGTGQWSWQRNWLLAPRFVLKVALLRVFDTMYEIEVPKTMSPDCWWSTWKKILHGKNYPVPCS